MQGYLFDLLHSERKQRLADAGPQQISFNSASVVPHCGKITTEGGTTSAKPASNSYVPTSCRCDRHVAVRWAVDSTAIRV